MKVERLNDREVVDVLLGDADPSLAARGRRAMRDDPSAAALRDEWSAILPTIERESAIARQASDRVRQAVMARLPEERADAEASIDADQTAQYDRIAGLVCALLGPTGIGARRRILLGMAAVAPLVILASTFLYLSAGPKPRAMAEQVMGDVFRTGVDGGQRRLVVGDKLTLPFGVKSSSDASASLRLDTDTKVVLLSGADLYIVSQSQVRQFAGSAFYRASRDDIDEGASPFTVKVPAGRIIDLGTEFRVAILDDGVVAVKVDSGKVRIEPDQGEAVEVLAGEAATLTDTRAVVIPPGGSVPSRRSSQNVAPTGPLVMWEETETKDKWSPRSAHAAVSFNDNLWVIGGDDVSDDLQRDVWRSENGEDWERVCKAAPWSARLGHASVAFAGKLWVLGGDTGHEQLSDVWHSEDGREWTRATAKAPWAGRLRHAAVVHDDRMWILGGVSLVDGKRVRHNDVWSSRDGYEWTQATDCAPWSPRHDLAAVAFDGGLWVIGGDEGPVRTNDIWYSVDGQHWMEITPVQPWWSPRMGHSVVAHDGGLWVVGGQDRGEYMNDVWHSADGVHWSPAADQAPWTPRGDHACVPFKDRLWIIGGRSSDAQLGDVWR